MALRWGIVGVGQISHDFCTALASPGFDSSDDDSNKHQIVAVGSRHIQRSKEFALRHNIATYYDSYEKVASNHDVEIVYIANLNNLHFDTCMLMLQHGKHVLCEKPFAMNHIEAKQIVQLAQQKNLFVMEGVWSRFFPVCRYLSQLLAQTEDLQVEEVFVKHGFKGDTVDRVTRKELGGGIVLDIGVYAIQFVLMVMRAGAPKSIVVKNCKINANGVDMFFEVDLKFDSNRVAHIICSGMEQLENKATVVTNKGVITVPTYWCPTELTLYDNSVKQFPLPDLVEGSFVHFTNSLGLHYEADEVLKCIRSGELFSDRMPPEETLFIAQIQDEIRRQIQKF